MAGALRLHGPRAVARWEFLLLDADDTPLRRLVTVTGGSLSVNANTRLKSSGTLSMDEPPTPIDWMQHRVQVLYDPGVRGVQPWAMATMRFASPNEKVRDGVTSYDVELLSKMSVVDEDSMEQSFSLPAGTQIIPAVVDLITSTGESKITVTESAATLLNPQAWKPGASKLDIINDLLEAAGYWSLWVDGAGFFRVEPYVDPASRAVSWTFEHGETSIVKPERDFSQDLASVPNKYIVIGQGDDENPPLVGVALNEDPDSPFSFQARGGRWVARTEEGVEGEGQAVVDQLAQRRLFDAMSPVAKLSVEHGIVPLNQNEVVEFVYPERTCTATVQSMTYDLKFDGHCKAEWRQL